MRLLLSLCFVSTLAFSSSLVVPISVLYTTEYKTCSKSALNTKGTIDCINKEYIYQDKILNKTYREVQKELASFRHKDLQNMQRKWLRYKDVKCQFYKHKESGSGGGVDSSFCQLNETILRTIELKELY